jgi:hypothetical protein
VAEWIQSNGGPLLLLPAELLRHWGGAATSDYERACAVREEIAELKVGNGVGLVLGVEPHQTAWVPRDDGGLLVRWVYAEREAEAWAAVASAREGDVEPSSVASLVGGASGRCILFDSADSGHDLRSAYLELSLAPGLYSVGTGTLSPGANVRLLVHRLRRCAEEA